MLCNCGGCSSIGRAPDCGSGRCGFESHLPPHFMPDIFAKVSGSFLILTFIDDHRVHTALAGDENRLGIAFQIFFAKVIGRC